MTLLLRVLFSQHLPLLGIGLMLLALLHMIVRTSGAVAETAKFDARAVALTSEVLAEELASFLIATENGEVEPAKIRSRAGFSIAANLVAGGAGGQLKIQVTSPSGRQIAYTAGVLEGAAPFPLGRPLSISRAALSGSSGPWDWIWKMSIPAPTWLPVDDFPRVLTETRDQPGLSPDRAGIRIDRQIALLYLDAGTDMDDYRFDVGGEGTVHIPLARDSWVGVQGNFWVAAGDQPVAIELDRHLTILVHGNIYLGSKLRVSGEGRLTLVALRSPSHCFRDRDLDGCFSAGDEVLGLPGSPYQGWVEGSGSVYLGLPGSAVPPQHLQIDGSLIAEGEVYLRAQQATIRGALVIGSGFTREDEACMLALPGDLLPETNRERVPGFALTGERRAGRLRREN